MQFLYASEILKLLILMVSVN